jgi:hypothetical protein
VIIAPSASSPLVARNSTGYARLVGIRCEQVNEIMAIFGEQRDCT